MRLNLQFYRPEVKANEVLPGLRVIYKTGYVYEDDEGKPQLLRRSRQRWNLPLSFQALAV